MYSNYDPNGNEIIHLDDNVRIYCLKRELNEIIIEIPSFLP